MKLPVATLLGLAHIPQHRSSASAWLRRARVPVNHDVGNGGKFEYVNLADLPEDVRRAYELRQIEEAGLPAGEYDDAAHALFAAATPAMQTVVLRKSEIACFLTKGGASDGRGLTSQLAEAARAKFGADGTDKMSLRRILRAVAGIDPVNFAPALLPGYARAGRPPAEISDEAWSFFMTTLRDAGPQFPLKQAWCDVRDVARKRGWSWPAYNTIWRRWDALPEAQKFHARHGREAAVRALSMPITAGNLDPDQPGLASLLRLVGRAVEGMETEEIAALGMLDKKLRRCASEQAEARRQAALQERN